MFDFGSIIESPNCDVAISPTINKYHISFHNNQKLSDDHETHISDDVLGQYVSRQRSLRKCQLCKHYIGDDELGNTLHSNLLKINEFYEVSDLQEVIDKLEDFNKEKLKLFALDLYNIICQFDEERIKIYRPYSRTSTASPINSSRKSRKISFHESIRVLDDEEFIDDDYEKVNDYLLVDTIGQGKQGIVYKAFKLTDNTQKPYAIKKIKIKTKIGEARDAMTEISIMKSLNHPNIVKLHEIIKDNDHIYIIMDFINNGVLMEQKIDGTYDKLPKHKISKYAKQLASAIKYLHKHNIAHRDIKPDNILIDDQDNVYLSDFGVSEFVCKKRLSLNSRNGTIMFFPPEMFMVGTKINGLLTDIWALGVTIFIMMYGSFPFNGKTYDEIKINILKPPEYPEYATYIEKNFFDSMFQKDSVHRMHLTNIQNHPIFNTENETITQVSQKQFDTDTQNTYIDVTINHKIPQLPTYQAKSINDENNHSDTGALVGLIIMHDNIDNFNDESKKNLESTVEFKDHQTDIQKNNNDKQEHVSDEKELSFEFEEPDDYEVTEIFVPNDEDNMINEDENKYMRPFGAFIHSPESLRVPIGPKELIRAKAAKRFSY